MSKPLSSFLALLLALALVAPVLAQGVDLQRRARVEAEPVDEVEAFREDLLAMVDELELALVEAARNPLVGADVERLLAVSGFAVPFPKTVRESIEYAPVEEIARAREMYAAHPALFDVPAVIREALVQLDAPPPSVRAADLCTTNYDAFEGFKSKRSTIKGITRARNILGLTLRLTTMTKTLVGSFTEDTPYVGRIPAIALIVLAGLQDIAINVLGVISGGIGVAKDIDELSIAACCVDPASSQALYGRGCDNRDNNCAGGADEAAEDLFAPTLAIDTSVLARCYPAGAEAREALQFAVTASDDCSDVSASIQLNEAPAICTAFATIQVTDDAGNSTSEGPLELTLDPTPPVLDVPPFAACYATIAEARNDAERTVVTDCTGTRVDIDTTPAACAAQISITAEDECGNRTEVLDEVVIDGAAPMVDIRKLLLPSVDGVFCFDSTAAAVAAVEGVTTVADNCTAENDLSYSTTASGPACATTVTSTAIDECGRVGIDALPARIDDSPPTVQCSVATPTLWPPDGTLRDIGFSMTAVDDCDPYGDLRIEVVVTSDEPTALARHTLGGDDPYPDAELLAGADGNVQAIRLRAERSDYGPGDGRVYRITVVATDACGLSSRADCWVDVPRELNRGQGINTGQQYRADRRN